MANVGSALLWRRLESFSACVSCRSILLVTLFLRPLSERKLKRCELDRGCCSDWEAACWVGVGRGRSLLAGAAMVNLGLELLYLKLDGIAGAL